MKKNIIVEISEGLGNQMFMYAHAYALSRELNYNLIIDNKSGYSKNKNLLRSHQKYMLDNFLLEGLVADKNNVYDTPYKRIKKKILVLLDIFLKKKNFLIEKKYIKDSKKNAISFYKLDQNKISNNLYIQGNFENSKYFEKYKNDLQRIFTVKDKKINTDSFLINRIKEANSVSIHIRRNRFSDQTNLIDQKNIKDSENFIKSSIEYINKSINYFNNKIKNPEYFIWTNDNKNINDIINLIDVKKSVLIYNNPLDDFNLFKYCKHFIVGPSSYHWWGAWLNNNPGKICVRPRNINQSNNNEFWPDYWISI
mgnify:FL=1